MPIRRWDESIAWITVRAEKSARGPDRSSGGEGSAAGLRPFPFEHVVARQRHGIDPLGELHLPDDVSVVAEGELAAGQVELPHPAEPLIVERLDLLACD